MSWHSCYFEEALTTAGIDEIIALASRDLANVDFDTLVGTGLSGAVIIPSLARALGKSFVLIRKDNDDSHHGKGQLLGRLGERYVFVDDFISSGRTQRRVIEKIGEAADRQDQPTTYVGAYLYVIAHRGGDGFKPPAQFEADVVRWTQESLENRRRELVEAATARAAQFASNDRTPLSSLDGWRNMGFTTGDIVIESATTSQVVDPIVENRKCEQIADPPVLRRSRKDGRKW